MSTLRFAAIGSLLFGFHAAAVAQQLGYISALVVPLLADTESYQTQIFVHNPSTTQISVQFRYVGGTTSVTPGLRSCNALDLPPATVVKTSLTALCPTLNPGLNFGGLATFQNSNSIAIYTRTQTPSGNGFSVEGMFEFGFTCCGQVTEVVGLIRQADPPEYQSNCFIWNLEDRAGRIVTTLATGDGQSVASQIVDVQASEYVRQLDVFSTLGAAPGDYVNVRASFESIVPFGGGNPVNFLAACTVQNSTSFDADFRIAKSHN